MFTLNGFHPQLGDLCQYFTLNEISVAMQVATQWRLKGYQPFMYSCVNGQFKVAYDWRGNASRKAA